MCKEVIVAQQHLPEKPTHSKILRVYPGYLEEAKNDPMDFVYSLSKKRSPRINQAILDIFTQAGFTIAEGGVFNEENSNELGLLLRHRYKNKEDFEQIISESVGVKVPTYLRPEQIVSATAPILAKRIGSAKGEEKWLLETTDQKIKFLTYWLLEEKILNPSLWINDLDRIFEEVKKGKLKGEWTGQLFKNMGGGQFINDYKYQEYKSSLSSYNTSIRVWVDAFGKIHGAVLIRSKGKKGNDFIPDDDNHKLEAHFNERQNRTITTSETYFANPKSPFYLKARDVTSNSRHGGGHVIYLKGEPCLNKTDSMVLQNHGIDPSRPILPEEIARYSSNIGRLSRTTYPIVGVDFLPSDQLYYLETNVKPGFFPKAVNLPKGLNESQQLLEMIKRVAFSIA